MTHWHLEDYTPRYFEQVPAARDEIFGGKFVLIAHQDDRWLVFAPIQLCRWHGDIVERFAEAHHLLGRRGARDGFYFDRPAWAVEGGAMWEKDTRRGQLRLYGRSGAYGGLSFPVVAQGLEEAGLEDGWKLSWPGSA